MLKKGGMNYYTTWFSFPFSIFWSPEAAYEPCLNDGLSPEAVCVCYPSLLLKIHHFHKFLFLSACCEYLWPHIKLSYCDNMTKSTKPLALVNNFRIKNYQAPNVTTVDDTCFGVKPNLSEFQFIKSTSLKSSTKFSSVQSKSSTYYSLPTTHHLWLWRASFWWTKRLLVTR